jgi:uncharacterized protein YaiI (UPF0178 family)
MGDSRINVHMRDFTKDTRERGKNNGKNGERTKAEKEKTMYTEKYLRWRKRSVY